MLMSENVNSLMGLMQGRTERKINTEGFFVCLL